jgi:O-acetyl-ADP-ribose deacetylase (regulator of RNase III)
LFPDCGEFVRNRSLYHESHGDTWQIEALCNIAAAEILMPAAALADIDVYAATIDDLMKVRLTFGVSAEALLIRLAELAATKCLMFCASAPTIDARYKIDYAIPSALWDDADPTGLAVPRDSAVAECTAIGFTARRTEMWPGLPKIDIECVGLPPYPGTTVPRVVGLALPGGRHAATRQRMTYVTGDATRPRGNEPVILAHVVNDATPNWGGGGFAMALRRRWPAVQEQYRAWAAQNNNLSLGNVHFARADEHTVVASIIAQHGYGESKRPRIRYGALRSGLATVAEFAQKASGAVHMPRIGTGQARGLWDIVLEIIQETIVARGVPTTVYTPPNAAANLDPQRRLSLFS